MRRHIGRDRQDVPILIPAWSLFIDAEIENYSSSQSLQSFKGKFKFY